MAGESRQTQVVANVNRVGSDSAVKVFELTDHVIAATAGWAFLQPQGATLQRNIASLVDDFKTTLPANASVQTVVTSLWNHFSALYQQHITQLPATAMPAGQVALSFVVAGYDPGSVDGKLFGLEIPSTTPPTAPLRTTNQPGPLWIGQADVVARIMNGFDPQVLSLPFVQAANQANNIGTSQLMGVNYVVSFNTMTLQDAIDFTVGMIQITITTQRFTAGTSNQLGAIAGVGGPIDVAVIQPGQTVSWIAKKQLHSPAA